MALFADLHGHSKRRGIFAYGCSRQSLARGVAPPPGAPPPRGTEKVYAKLLEAEVPDLFTLAGSSFRVQARCFAFHGFCRTSLLQVRAA